MTCELGISHVGYVMAVMGAMNMMTSLVAGVIGKWTGQLPLFLFGGLMNLVLLAVMFTWRSNSGSSVMYYVISGLLGLVDGVFQSQTGSKFIFKHVCIDNHLLINPFSISITLCCEYVNRMYLSTICYFLKGYLS